MLVLCNCVPAQLPWRRCETLCVPAWQTLEGDSAGQQRAFTTNQDLGGVNVGSCLPGHCTLLPHTHTHRSTRAERNPGVLRVGFSRGRVGAVQGRKAVCPGAIPHCAQSTDTLASTSLAVFEFPPPCCCCCRVVWLYPCQRHSNGPAHVEKQSLGCVCATAGVDV